MSTGFQNVHIRVNDAATGKPTPVRIRFVGSDGKYHAPFGRLTEFATGPGEDVGGNVQLGDKKYAYIDGACEIRLPVGMLEVEIHKGPEYLPVHEKVELKQGKLSMRFEIRRWIDMRSQGWYAGDTSCFHLSPHAALLEAQAEDLAVVNLLACLAYLNSADGKQRLFLSNMLAFSGQQPALESNGHMVVVNTLNSHAMLGQLALLNCHRPVFPLVLGDIGQLEEWNLADWCEQCHRKAGLVVARSFFPDAIWLLEGEVLADSLLGYIDAVELNRLGDNDLEKLDHWNEFIQCGFSIPLVGGSDKRSNQQLTGTIRTFARLPEGEPFSYKNWIESVRAGRTFITGGPLLSLKVNGASPGSVIDAPEPKQVLGLKVEAKSLTDFGRLELLFNNQVVESKLAIADEVGFTATIETEEMIVEPGWYYARCVDASENPESPRLSACTSPIHVRITGQAHKPNGKLISRFENRLDQMVNWVNQHGRFENDQQRQRMADVYLAAKKRLKERQAASG